jgi:hypothetical protein
VLILFSIKKPVTNLLNNTDLNKPNIIVRKTGFLTQKLSFTNAYAIKNTFRAFTRSATIFISVLFSSILLLFAMLTGSFVERSITQTMKVADYESREYNNKRIAYLNDQEIKDFSSNDYSDPNYEYNFGANYNYYSETEVMGRHPELFPTSYNPLDEKDFFAA